MPEPRPPQPPRSHTSTVQWQSFEVRMRQRRAERCLLRAEVALEAGFPDDARVAVDEARFLDPCLPGLDELEQRIEATGAVAPPGPPARRNPRLGVAAVALLVAILCTLLWLPDREDGAGAAEMKAPAGDADAAVPAAVSIREELVTASVVEPDVPAKEPAERRTAALRESPSPPPLPPSAPAARPSPPAPTIRPPVVAALAPVESAPPVAAAPVPEATAAARPPAAEPEVNHIERVRAVLSRYEAAYSGLDAAAARAVWPAVDERALARAFNGLASQRVSLEACDVSIDGGSARAECAGSATWVPKVGGGGRTVARRWSFDLRQAGGGWQIVRAEAR